MKLTPNIKYIAIAVGVVVVGGGLYAGAQSLANRPKKQTQIKQVQESIEESSTTKKLQSASSTTSKASTNPGEQQSSNTTTNGNTQAPWQQGPSDQEPAGNSGSNSGGGSGAVNPGEAPWGQGQSEQ